VTPRASGSSTALVASLFKGLLDRGVEVAHGHRRHELVGGRRAVTGCALKAASCSGPVKECGCVLELRVEREMVKTFIGQHLEPMSPPYNEGDGHLMAMERWRSWPT